ncbi:MAG: response regulator [Candidatus Marinimicrobia bacterium]|nr:response regulator [Candidatus Neomarinimicrobiota bacterium]
MKVLFVDDSPTMRRIIANSLIKIGFSDLVAAENGVDALNKLKDTDVDLIITDWNMPEMNGEKLVIKLRENPRYKDTPILVVTTRGMQEDVVAAVRIGADGYMVKPFSPEVLKQKIKGILK